MPKNSSQNENYISPWPNTEPRDRILPSEQPEEGKKPRLGKIIVAAVVLLLILGIGAGYYLLNQNQEKPNVFLEFSQPAQVLVGQPFVLRVSFSNYSDNVLKNADLSLVLPEDVSFLGQPQDQRVMERPVGDVGPGSINQQSFDLIVTGGNNSLKRLEAALSYSTGVNSQAQFRSNNVADVAVGESAIGLTIGAPASVFNGENFEINVDYKNNSNAEFKNVRFAADYPPIFRFQRSSMNPEDNANMFWNLGSVTGGNGADFTIVGNAVGPEGSSFDIGGALTATFLGQVYTLNSQKVNIAIAAAPLSLTISVNDEENYVSRPSDSLQYVFAYKNNSDISFQNVSIAAKFIGELFDFTTLQTNAFFDSINNTVSWSVANTAELQNLAPHEERSISLQIKTKASFPIRRLSDKNYALKVQAQIQSSTVPPGTAAQKTFSLANLETKVIGAIAVNARAFFRDAASGILNSGVYPPRVNHPTQYTVHWIVTNYSTDVTDVNVSAYLQSGTRFTGVAKSNVGSLPIYNSATGQVTWNIGNLPATKGVISPPAEAIFQIENTPSVNQTGQNVLLLSNTGVVAQDSFTSSTLESVDSSLSTDLPDDTTIIASDRRVQP